MAILNRFSHKLLFSLLLAATASSYAGIVSTVVTETAYDAYGNPVSRVVETTANEPAGTRIYRQTTRSTFQSSTGADWLPGVPTCSMTATEIPTATGLQSSDLLKIASVSTVYFTDSAKLDKPQTVSSGPVLATAVPATCTAPDAALAKTSTLSYRPETGQLASTTVGTGSDARTNSIAYAYNERGVFQTNALGHKSLVIYTAFGKKMLELDANYVAKAWRGDPHFDYWLPSEKMWRFDVLGRDLQHDLDANGLPQKVLYEACAGNICNGTIVEKLKTTLTTAGTTEPRVFVFLDKLGREVRRNTLAFDGRELNSKNTYNAKGQLIEKRAPYYASPVTADEAGRFVSMTYDGAGRLKTTTESDTSINPTPRQQSINYLSAFETQTINAKGQRRTELNDARGLLRKVTDNLGLSQQYVYDASGKLRKTTDPKGNVIELVYNERGLRTGFIDPDMGTWSYTYDAFDNLQTQTDAKGQVSTHHYDKLNRLTQREETDLNSFFEYDDATVGFGGIGRLFRTYTTSAIAPDYDHRYSYSLEGLVTADSYPKAYGFSGANQYGYSNGRLETVYLNTSGTPGGMGTYKYTYTNGYVSSVNYFDPYNTPGTGLSTGDMLWRADKRAANGQVLRSTFGSSGISTEHKYKNTGELDSIVAGVTNAQGNGSDASVQNDSYIFDDAGNLVARNQSAVVNLAEAFTYDAGNRLVSSQLGQVVKTQRYDELGNLVFKTGVGYYTYGQPVNELDPAFNATSGSPAVLATHAAGTCGGVHRVCAITSALPATAQNTQQTLSYDANGNVIANVFGDAANGNNRQYTDYLGNPNQVMSFNLPANIVKNIGGQGTATDNFFYDTAHRMRYRGNALADSDPNTRRTYYYHSGVPGMTYEQSYHSQSNFFEDRYPLLVDGEVVGNLVYRPTYNQAGSATGGTMSTQYFHTDNQGSVVAVTDQTGAVLERYSYDVWGKRRNLDGSDDSAGTLSASATDHGYTGHQMLDTQSLVHMKGRLYDPQLARFVSADPTIDGAGSIQGFNRYAYVHNNPATLIDPSGFSAGMFDVEVFLRGTTNVRVTVTSHQDGSTISATVVNNFGSGTNITTGTSGTGSSATATTATVVSVTTYNPNAPAWANAPYVQAQTAYSQYVQQMAFFNEVNSLISQGLLAVCSGGSSCLVKRYDGSWKEVDEGDLGGVDGQWGVSAGAFVGLGAAVEFGHDSSGSFFVLRVGVGAGGGVAFNPAATRPGGPRTGGVAAGLYGEAAFAAPFVTGNLGAQGGAINHNDGSSSFYLEPISDIAVGPEGGFRLEGSAGAAFTFSGGK